jgi:hypothetical protein
VLVSGVLGSHRRGKEVKASEINFEFGRQHYEQICHRAGEGCVLGGNTEVNLGED